MTVKKKNSAGGVSRENIIKVAGRIFAQRGMGNITLNDISEATHCPACTINYHFKNKDGLIMAVIEHAMKDWEPVSIVNFCKKNQNLLEEKQGQAVFITGLVECVFNSFGTDNDEKPCKSLLLQLLQFSHPLRETILERYVNPIIKIFQEIFMKITGDGDFESALCWFLMMVCPIYVHTSSPGLVDKVHPEGKVSASFRLRMRYLTTQVMLHGLGLDRVGFENNR